jgi:hypothetical protein
VDQQPSEESALKKSQVAQPCFEHVTIKEEPSINEKVKDEMSLQMKEEPESEDDQFLMSSAVEESASDEYDVDKPDKLEEQTNGERIKLHGRYKHNPDFQRSFFPLVSSKNVATNCFLYLSVKIEAVCKKTFDCS